EPAADPAQGDRAAGGPHRDPADRQRVHHAAQAHLARVRDLAARAADRGAGAFGGDVPVPRAADGGARLLPGDREHPDGRPVAARAAVHLVVAPRPARGPSDARGLPRRALMADVVLRAEGVQKRYGDLEVLQGVTFEVDRGEVKVIIGPSGSGKSTLLRCLAMLEAPDAGDVYLETERLTAFSEKQLAPHRSEVGMVFQRFNLFRNMTALGNVMCGLVE